MNRAFNPTCTAALVAVLLGSCGAAAEEIYKIVDDDGRVTYSNAPPPGGAAAEVISPLPPPPPKDVEDARRRQREIEQQFERLDRYRAEQERLRQEARGHGTATVVQNTIIVGGSALRRSGFYPGARPARGARTAPGFRPRPLHAVPLPHGRPSKVGP